MRKKHRRKIIIWKIVFIVVTIMSKNIVAGDLDSFEKSVSSDTGNNDVSGYGDSNSRTVDSKSCEGDFNLVDCVVYTVFESIGSAMLYGGYYSLARVNSYVNKSLNAENAREAEKDNSDNDNVLSGATDDGTDGTITDSILLRKTHEPQVPYVRVDASLQYINSNTSGKDYRLTSGYGPVAIQYSKTQFDELNPGDALSLSRLYLAYQMSFYEYFQVDLGLGTLNVNGNSQTRLSYLTIPVRFHIPKFIGVEYKPAWSGNISDYDLGLFYHFKYVSIKAGYRWLSANSQSLDGSYAGFTFFY